MSRPALKRARVRTWIAVLSVAAVVFLLSSKLTGGVSGVLQAWVPLQHLMSSVLPSPRAEPVQLSGDQAERLKRKLDAYEQQFMSMSARIADLQERNEELSGIRSRGLHAGRLIHAKIVAADSLPWRASRLLDEGTLAGVQRGGLVISDFFVNVGAEAGVVDGMSVLSGEVLLGEIVDASTHTSRLLLLTDPAGRPILVRIGRRSADGIGFAPADFMLRGMGANRMVIQGVSHDLIDQGAIRRGDTVITAASDDRLPVQVVVGQVVDLQRDDGNAVLYDVVVAPAVDLNGLDRVYVVDPTS